ncbi:crossover junction endodeoxyribonuclease RuvC [candidate division WOR-1 bacterium RIFOXYB2_FULL_48_7]|uniref:Crossover junction endodeoxyribonuclease RuvC n=1 Tax=candidate division WOR-1 bacterium RIFOXYB2_FULL_48_7 TaxID=1802583 RepID=A0A1F4TS21_UNCSA|nr:MAG: crossover junction endodeoxyribonuclease RuvC [candidate division WOR-1 bacterium RIFOXYB2_FULL_48_7]
MLTLGIDPGIATTGFGLVDQQADKLVHVRNGAILTSPSESTAVRIGQIYKELKAIIAQYKPEVVAVERLYFGQNTKTAMIVGQARGIILLAATEAGLPIAEYTPLQVKMALTGYGKAEKRQIQLMVKMLLGLSTLPKPDDAADALAVAITHINTFSLESRVMAGRIQ